MDAWMLGCLSNELFGLPVPAGAPIGGPSGRGGVTLGLHLDTLGLYSGTLGVNFCIFFQLWGGALEP